jgi:OOP family OmpA-OmpF porin
MQARDPQPTISPRGRRLRTHPLRPEELEELRRQLIGPEQRRLDDLEVAAPTAETVGALIPTAVAYASHERGDELTTALAEPVRHAVRSCAHREPHIFGEILAPAIGTAVRRAVADAFAALLQRINQLVEQGLSWRSLKWRLEAKRTGRTYAEIVLSKTLVYRVEWAVLIHTESSLVLEQASSIDALAQAPDQTSAMLQAINSFVSDALEPASPGAAIQAIDVGDLSLWIERDAMFTLAIAIRGTAPLSLRDHMRQTLKRVRTLHPERTAMPDVGTFADTHPLLLASLEQQRATPPGRASWMLAAAGVLILVLLAGLQVHATRRHHHDAALAAAYERVLRGTPGYAITSVEHHGDGFRVRGLRDPRALPAAMVVLRAGLPLPLFDLAPFDSADPHFETPMARVGAEIRALERVELSFPLGESLPIDMDQTKRAAELIRRAQVAARQANASLCVDIVGGSDDTGGDRTNERLRVARATEAARALERAGVEPAALVPRTNDPMRRWPHLRTVTFRAVLRPAAAQRGCP